MTYSEMINLSMNQTLARSINTSLVAILPVLAVLVVGAELLGADDPAGLRPGPDRRAAQRGLLVDLHRLAGPGHAEGARAPLRRHPPAARVAGATASACSRRRRRPRWPVPAAGGSPGRAGPPARAPGAGTIRPGQARPTGQRPPPGQRRRARPPRPRRRPPRRPTAPASGRRPARRRRGATAVRRRRGPPATAPAAQGRRQGQEREAPALEPSRRARGRRGLVG